MEKKTIKGIVTDKKAYTGDNKNAPSGNFYIGSDKYTCWDQPQFESFGVGDEVNIDYTEQSNEFNGKKYVNKNISSITSPNKTIDEKDIKYSDKEKEELEKVGVDTKNLKSPEGEINVGRAQISGFTYEVVLRLIS